MAWRRRYATAGDNAPRMGTSCCSSAPITNPCRFAFLMSSTLRGGRWRWIRRAPRCPWRRRRSNAIDWSVSRRAPSSCSVMGGKWIASYRLQLHAGFPLRQAQQVLPYLAELGISHVYLSPCLQAVPGSLHGYDVTDPTRISEDLGGESAWAGFVDCARSHQLGILLDIVPNHMSASEHNPWWDHVLAHGPFSEFADYFDFRNLPHRPFRVHLCSLARPYGAALEAGELSHEAAPRVPRRRHY